MEPLIKMSQELKKNQVIQALIQDQTKSPEEFKAAICEEDEMFLYSLKNLKGDSDRARVRYYSLGRRILDSVKQVVEWHFGDFKNVSSFLDFACGYGRFTRFLIQEIPAEKVWVSDIYAGAVQFQSEYFGVNGFVSTTNPENYQLQGKFDCILANSFFSHMPEKTFANWVQTLYDLLTPGGLLMFSVHDESLLPNHIEMNPKGILFSPDSESRTLDGEEYGTTYVSEQFVREVVNKVSNSEAIVHRIKQGICRFQDLYVVTNQPGRDFSTFRFAHHPDAHVDVAYFTPLNRLHLEGWAADFNQEGRIEEIQVLINGEIVQRCLPFYNRPDLAQHYQTKAPLQSGWSCYVHKSKVSPDAVLMVKTINNYGLELIVETSTVESLVSNKRSDSQRFSTEAKLERMQAKLGAAQKELDGSQEQVSYVQKELDKFQVQLSTTQSQLAESQAQLATTQSQLAESQAQLATTQSQLEESQSQLEKSQAQLATTQSQLEEFQVQLAATQAQLQQVQTQLLLEQEDLKQSQIRLVSAEAEAERSRYRMVAMESSKFWKARRVWFRVKRAIGLKIEDE